MDLEKVRELVKLVEESQIDELELSSEEATIRIQKHSGMMMQVPQMMAVPAAQAQTVMPQASLDVSVADPIRARWRDVRSPIVGTFYGAPSPDAQPFVQVGDKVTIGQTLCIIEAMKVMNEIDAEFSGVIKEILAENATPIEAEAILFLIDPS